MHELIQLKETEKAYIAGIIDGEGSIMLIKNKSGTFPSPSFSIASTTLELLIYLKNTIGNGTIKTKNNYKPSQHRNSYTYDLRGDAVLLLSNEIHPYLQIESKKARSTLLINDYKNVTIRNGRYTPLQLQIKEEFYDQFISYK